jgi:hypothetical protein
MPTNARRAALPLRYDDGMRRSYSRGYGIAVMLAYALGMLGTGIYFMRAGNIAAAIVPLVLVPLNLFVAIRLKARQRNS